MAKGKKKRLSKAEQRAELRRKSREYKSRHPWRYAFNYHKQNARRRLHYLPRSERWSLSFSEFMSIWDAEPDKKKEKERSFKGGELSACRWEIDRIDDAKGYNPGNVRLVTKVVNVALYYAYKRGEIEEDWLRCFTQTPEQIEASLEEIRKNCPF